MATSVPASSTRSPACGGGVSLTTERGPGQVGLDRGPPLLGVRQLRRVVRAGDDGQPSVGDLGGQLGRLIDQRVIVLAHDDASSGR